ncbi:MAG: PPC domain-containing protein [Coriobacteriia bacterium]|nr:PPC domain-containing protein [Coriobacteriia bacterium]
MSTVRRGRFGAWICTIVLATSLAAPSLAVAEIEPDDQIPGLSKKLPFSEVGTLTFFVGEEEVGDVGDIYAVWLNAGETLRTGMRGSSQTLFHLSLLRPGTPSIYDDPDDIVAFSKTVNGDPTQKYLRYKAPAAGTYYLHVWMQEDSPNGSYAIHVKRTALYSITRPNVPAKVTRGKWFNITGYVTPGYLFTGKAVTVQLQKRVGSRWVTKLSHKSAPFGFELGKCRYGARAQLSSGRWRARGSIGDSVESRRYSAWREFTVR